MVLFPGPRLVVHKPNRRRPTGSVLGQSRGTRTTASHGRPERCHDAFSLGGTIGTRKCPVELPRLASGYGLAIGRLGQLLCGVVAVLVALLMVRSWFVEPFVIPSGSMAPTLLGVHAELTCRQCSYRFAYGLDGGSAGRVVCPNCGHVQIEETDPPGLTAIVCSSIAARFVGAIRAAGSRSYFDLRRRLARLLSNAWRACPAKRSKFATATFTPTAGSNAKRWPSNGEALAIRVRLRV